MRERILETAESMVQERGLNAVSFQHLATAVGISKPSIFHHFPNKEALALGLVDRCNSHFGPLYEEVIGSDGSAPEKLRRLTDLFEEGLKGGKACLMASLGGSVETLPDTVQVALGEAVRASIARIARIFSQGREEHALRFEGTPDDAAAAFLAAAQGLQVLARAQSDILFFRRSMDAFINGHLV